MFAEGLYRNALKMLGTPRAPSTTAAHAVGVRKCAVAVSHATPRPAK